MESDDTDRGIHALLQRNAGDATTADVGAPSHDARLVRPDRSQPFVHVDERVVGETQP